MIPQHYTSSLIELIRSILKEVMEGNVPDLSEHSDIQKDLAMSSLMFVQFLLALEERVPGLQFDPELLDQSSFNRLDSLISYIHEHSDLKT